MDWPYEDPGFSQNDFEEVFTYVPCASKTICQYVGDEEPREFTIQTDRDLKGWIEEVETQKSSPGLAVILAGRHHLSNNPANLQYLPFSREGFQNLVELLPLHGDTARHINRTDVPYFTDINLVHRGGAVYHICRTSAAWSGDMAVSSVFDPETGFTRGVVFGCSENTTTEFDGRIYNSETAWTHPMLLVAILVELERIRHFDLVKERVAQLLSQVRAMNKAETISSTSELAQDNYSVNHWILVSQLLIALEAWKVQLNKMDNHITDLEKTFFSDSPQPSRGASPEMSSDASSCKVSPASWKIHAKDTGRRIQKRLREILGEYDERIRECLMVLNGMALAAQLSWNQIGYQDTQANLKIATDTRKDSNQMRSIAFLTMIFLPATFLASLFSMTFFNWGASEGEHVVSPLLWIYFALAIGITLIVVGCWYLFTRAGRRPPSQDEEKGFGARPRRAGTDMSWVTKDTGLLSSPSYTSKAPVGLDTKLQMPRSKAVDLSKAASSLRRLSRMLVFSGTKSNPKLRTGPLDGPFNTPGNFDTAYRQALAGGTNSRASTFATVPLPGYAVSRTHAITTPSPPFFDTKQSFNRDWGRAEKAVAAEGNSSNEKGTTNDGKIEFEKALPLPGKLSWKRWKGGTER